MTVCDLLEKNQLTKYRLSQMSGIPYTTIGDICSGKTELKKCSAETVYKLAKSFGVSMEDLLSDSLTERAGFELFKSRICHRVREMGDVDFIIDTLERREIRAYYERKWFPESFYLLGMLDYISRENDVPLCNEYDDLRRCKLKDVIYPSSVLALCAATKNDDAKKASIQNAIPEFMRFNIVESEVRNVI